jgi:Leucine-rich repeat (LRR) protein
MLKMNALMKNGRLDLRHYNPEFDALEFHTFPKTATHIYLMNAMVTHILPLPASVRTLDCSYSAIIELPDLPEGLEELVISNTNIKTLPRLPSTLKVLKCWASLIKTLPELPDGLQTLDIQHSNISQLPNPLPSQLQRLACGYTDIAVLPPLPSELVDLYCAETNITHIPKLPKTLKNLNCESLSLTELPALPDGLEFLWCANTQLTRLPDLPQTLVGLECYRVPFVTYPNAPPRVRLMNWNPIEDFPALERETLRDYVVRLRAFERKRGHERCLALKEEIVMKAFHPTNVQKWLDKGGHACLDMMFGFDASYGF